MMSTTLNKLEYLDETKGQIKTALNQFGAGITDETTFRDYTNKIEVIYNNWPKVTGSGTEITLNNTKAAKMVMDVKGNSMQETTTGKNLVDVSQSEQGSWLDDGSATTSDQNRRGTQFIAVLPNTTYTLSVNTQVNNVRLNEYNNLQEHIQRNGVSKSSMITITTTENTYFLRWSINYDNIVTFTQDILNTLEAQLELGSSRTDYEPYTNGASPNPDYPQTIYNAGDNGSITEKIENEGGTEVQNISIPCQQPMRSVNTVKDEFVKISDTWYERHNIAYIASYDGETITTDYMSTTGGLDTGASVQYVAETPTDLTCTEAQITVLEGLQQVVSYDTQTNINTTDTTPAYVEASALEKGGN